MCGDIARWEWCYVMQRWWGHPHQRLPNPSQWSQTTATITLWVVILGPKQVVEDPSPGPRSIGTRIIRPSGFEPCECRPSRLEVGCRFRQFRTFCRRVPGLMNAYLRRPEASINGDSGSSYLANDQHNRILEVGRCGALSEGQSYAP